MPDYHRASCPVGRGVDDPGPVRGLASPGRAGDRGLRVTNGSHMLTGTGRRVVKMIPLVAPRLGIFFAPFFLRRLVRM